MAAAVTAGEKETTLFDVDQPVVSSAPLPLSENVACEPRTSSSDSASVVIWESSTSEGESEHQRHSIGSPASPSSGSAAAAVGAATGEKQKEGEPHYLDPLEVGRDPLGDVP